MKNGCKHFNYSDEKQDLPNCIVVGAHDSDFEQLIIMNSKECQLFMDKTDPDNSWHLWLIALNIEVELLSWTVTGG